MAVLSKAQILQVQDIRTEELDVPEWGGTVIIRGMTGEERDRFEQEQIVITGKGRNRAVTQDLTNFRARLAIYCCVDENGEHIFSPGDIALLAKKSASALTRVAETATRLSGLSEDDQEQLLGNSRAGQSNGSGSGSHSLSATDPLPSANAG